MHVCTLCMYMYALLLPSALLPTCLLARVRFCIRLEVAYFYELRVLRYWYT